MLTHEKNALLTQCGPATPMGRLMRSFWIPAMTAAEVPAADEPPMRLTLLGERLVVFRDTEGRVGVLEENCPHRGASLFFGRECVRERASKTMRDFFRSCAHVESKTFRREQREFYLGAQLRHRRRVKCRSPRRIRLGTRINLP